MSHKGLTFVHLNVRSLYKHLDEIRISLKGYDIMAFTETWLNDRMPNSMIQLPGYRMFRQDRKGESVKVRGGGIVIYVAQGIVDFFNVDRTISTCTKDLEQCWAKLDIPHMKPIRLGVVYRPPSGIVEEAFVQLRNSTNSATDDLKTAEVIILGDLNINYSKKTTPEFKSLKSFERKYLLTQLIKTPTRITKRSKAQLIWSLLI